MQKTFEYQALEGQADDQNVFRNCKLLGIESQNGRTYKPEAISKGAPLYESASVFLDHDVQNPRKYQDRIGWIENPRANENGIYGDFVMNPKHPLAEQILWDAQHSGSGVGFSHCVNMTTTTDKQGKKYVESIDKVISVDLVANPATTKCFFEQTEVQQKEKTEAIDLVENRCKALETKVCEIEVLLGDLKKSLNKEKPIAVVPQAADPDTGYQSWIKRIKN